MKVNNKIISSNDSKEIAIMVSYEITVKPSLFGLAVGTDVGLKEGTDDGLGVGSADGAFDGFEVGTDVGRNEGEEEGAFDGFEGEIDIVGADDGFAVGANVGVDGATVGGNFRLVGFFDLFATGAPVWVRLETGAFVGFILSANKF